jgi:hypothetical protein
MIYVSETYPDDRKVQAAFMFFKYPLPLSFGLTGLIKDHGISDRKIPASFLSDRDLRLRGYLPCRLIASSMGASFPH